ncbi:hypothetical protein MHTCC0001_21620 [Flavobacteriaceae bacterium MHTCC 0001]
MVGASGCDGSTWTFKLVDSGSVAESLPVQRLLKLEFKNQEDCSAVFKRRLSFNLEPLQIKGNNTIILNLDGWDNTVTYSY